MTSREMQTRLREATVIVALCEQVFEDFEKAQRRGDDLDLQYAVRDFMDRYREQCGEGDPS